MNFGIGQRARRRLGNVSLIGTNLPERMRTLTVALLGLTTAAGLGLVLLFSQTTLSIPSLGPVTTFPGHQDVHAGVALGAAGTPRANPALAGFAPASSTPSLPLVVPAAAGDFAAAGAPRGDGGVGAAAGEGTSISGNAQDVPAVQPQPSAVGPTTAPGATEPGATVEPAPAPTPAPEPNSPAVPTGPGIPTSEPPVEEPEVPQPPVEEVPVEETPEEPPVTESPEEDEGEPSFLEAAGSSHRAD